MHLTDHLTEAQLNEYLDGEGMNSTQIESHLSSCADCAARLAALRNLFAELVSLPEVDLSYDLAATVTRQLCGTDKASPVVHRWLALTAVLQVAVTLVVTVIAGPFIIDVAASSLSVPQVPSLNDYLIEVQLQWITRLEMLSQLQMPSVPQLPLALDTSGLYFMLTLAGMSVLWLLGNGILLRNQIK